ncbi:MAG: HTTM domain-containing protein [Leptospiraceae bacterium]|nr:HTTM domain-containing protein [Leptospiraceae bacterium]MCP5512313.1 HTTM domain-containing protein [Leptospiraceae bacterium]
MKILNKKVPILPLVYYRVVLGCLLIYLLIRYFAYGWISKYFIDIQFNFPHFPFEILRPLPGISMFILFIVLLILAFFILIGFHTRISALFFSIGFAYQHLLEKAIYLNHYYLIFLLCILLILTNTTLTESSLRGTIRRIPNWNIFLIRFQLGVVYTFGAIAKMRPDWLREAQPLKIWLLMNRDMFLLGDMLSWKITPYFFSYAGLIFDLFVFPALLYPKTRKIAYFFVIVFHLLTFSLFPIGLFPWIMLFLTPICFSNRFHYRIVRKWNQLFKKVIIFVDRYRISSGKRVQSKGRILLIFALIYVFLQITLPFRHFFYPGNLLWTEEGFNFSWHIMACQKNGTYQFYAKSNTTGEKTPLNYDYLLSDRQLGQLKTDHYMIWLFAKEIYKREMEKGREDFHITVDHYVSLNGKKAVPIIDPNTRINEVNFNILSHNSWILPHAE